MRFSNFLFPASTSAADDGRAIDKTLEEARLTDTLGCDTIWLAEPISKAPSPMSIRSLSRPRWPSRRRARILVSISDRFLHHPIRLAAQIALIDHLAVDS
jgi:alkanesulfonate monooxygenase SsuD/methylene tetrahydromethanopterin reductase-like flavin-dependent oxidoreductase (luciferase family)